MCEPTSRGLRNQAQAPVLAQALVLYLHRFRVRSIALGTVAVIATARGQRLENVVAMMGLAATHAVARHSRELQITRLRFLFSLEFNIWHPGISSSFPCFSMERIGWPRMLFAFLVLKPVVV